MYSNLNLYYLNQMDIVPWVQKQAETQLLILVNELVTEQQERFFHRIMDYLALPEKNVFLLKFSTQDNLTLPTKAKNAGIILNLGLNSMALTALSLKGTVLSGFSLEFYLQNPIYKKELLHHLSLIKSNLN